MQKRICYVSLLLIVCFLFCRSSGVEAGELRPFVLPESRPSAVQMAPSRVQQQAPVETPSIYRQFENDVSRMTEADRQKLSQRFQALRSQAYRDGDRVKITYYDNLLNILSRYQ